MDPPAPTKPDYGELFRATELPSPPIFGYVTFDAPAVIRSVEASDLVLFGSDQESDPGPVPKSVKLDLIQNLLTVSVRESPRFDWSLYPQSFPDLPIVAPPPPAPVKPNVELKPVPELPSPPTSQDFLPKRVDLDNKIPFLYPLRCAIAMFFRQGQYLHAVDAHNAAYKLLEPTHAAACKHNEIVSATLASYAAERKSWQEQSARFTTLNSERRAEWEKRAQEFLALKAVDLARLVRLKEAYFKRDAEAVATHALLVLNRSPYPAAFPRKVDAAYDPEARILVVDRELPDIENIEIYRRKERISKNSYGHDNVLITATDKRRLSDQVLYMVMLRTIHEVVSSDEINAIDAIAVNGWMQFRDKANGQLRTENLMSMFATAEEVRKIDFANVDPKTCFRSLKGVSSARPTECIPVAPILRFDKSDRRIISSREIIEGLSIDTNLAAMAWDDFEHLIREVFEKEFTGNGAEVRVTQASHDRGVDALVFDPDPIRGGKFVIQAKRYTATVDVSAIRDLYGTVLNEGANRGILVTTSSFGADSYDFAKDKPLTLLDGSRLLNMLQKHGYQFRIDLKEARKLALEAGRPPLQ